MPMLSNGFSAAVLCVAVALMVVTVAMVRFPFPALVLLPVQAAVAALQVFILTR